MDSVLSALANKTILVTRPAGQSSQFSLALQQQGAMVIEMPALEIVPPSSWEALDQEIAARSTFSWLILTSTNGVDYFCQRWQAQGKPLTELAELKIAVVGKKTAHSLQKLGITPDLIPTNFVADSLAAELGQRDNIQGKRILFPRVETGGREVLVQELTAKGAEVVEVAAYQSGCPSTMAPAVWSALQSRQVDVVTFASSKTVDCFWQLLVAQGGDRSLLNQVTLASIGPQTSEACRQLLGRVDLEAQEFTMDGLLQAIVQWATSYTVNG